MIANELRKTHQVEEEVHGISIDGSHRPIDIIAIPSGSINGFIINPTIWMETGEEQPLQVHNEKCLIYDPTIPYYLDKPSHIY